MKNAEKLASAGDLAGAFKAYIAIHKQFPKNPSPLSRAHQVAADMNKPDLVAAVLSKLIALSPRNPALRQQFGHALFRCGRVGDAILAFRSGHELAPDNVETIINLAALCTAHGRHKEGLKYYSLLKDHPNKMAISQKVWADYAHAIAIGSFNFARTIEALEEAEKYVTDDAQALRSLARTADQASTFDYAHRYFSRYANQIGDTSLDLPCWLEWCRCLAMAGKDDQLAAVSERAITALEQKLTASTNAGEKDAIAILVARIKHLCGEEWQDELAQAVPQRSSQANNAVTCTEQAISDQFASSRKNWSRKIKGKDVCILLSGPSLALLGKVEKDISKWTNASFATVNSFGDKYDTWLKPAGQKAEILALLGGAEFTEAQDRILAALQEPDAPVIMTMAPIAGALPKGKQFLDNKTNLVFAFSRQNLPPSKDNMLRFEITNTLSLLIPMLIAAEPRRIFLFGADGGDPDLTMETYKGDIAASGTEVGGENYLLLLSEEARLCDNILEFQIPLTARLYGVDIPPIYNVGTRSNYKLFEMMDIKEASRELSQGA